MTSEGRPRTTTKVARNRGTLSKPETLLVIAFRSNCMPVTMKKIGMKTPKPTASRRGCISCLARAQHEVEVQPRAEVDERDQDQQRQPHRELPGPLERLLQHRQDPHRPQPRRG